MDYIMTIPKDSLISKELDHGTGNWGPTNMMIQPTKIGI